MTVGDYRLRGPRGVQGLRGPQGETGEQGPRGVQGPQGPTSDETQPLANVQAGGYAFVIGDIGAVVFATGAGAQPFTLPDLSAGIIEDRTALLTVQCTGEATVVTITPGAGSQIDGAGVGVPYVAPVGRSRISILSLDGLNWYSGTP